MSSYLGPIKTYECYMVGKTDTTISFYITVKATNTEDARRIVEAQYHDARIFGVMKEIRG